MHPSNSLALALVLALAACSRAEPSRHPRPVAPSTPVTASAPEAARGAPRALVDPLAPGRPLGTVAVDLPDGDAWVTARPPKETQLSLGRAERRVNPCEAPDPGLGVHRDWTHVRPMGQVSVPRSGVLDDRGEFDLVVHFHGHRPARKEVVRTGADLVLLGVSLGIGAAYGPPFADGTLFETLVASTERALAKLEGRPSARVRRLALSSWSRGYEAIVSILEQPIAERVDAIVLLDSLHASRDAARMKEQLAPFVAFAERASRGEKLFFASHSSIDPSEYASSTEAVHHVVAALGGRPVRAARRDPLGLDLIELYSRGDFHTRGYRGNGKLDHCAHFGVYPDALFAIAKRWETASRDAAGEVTDHSSKYTSRSYQP